MLDRPRLYSIRLVATRRHIDDTYSATWHGRSSKMTIGKKIPREERSRNFDDCSRSSDQCGKKRHTKKSITPNSVSFEFRDEANAKLRKQTQAGPGKLELARRGTQLGSNGSLLPRKPLSHHLKYRLVYCNETPSVGSITRQGPFPAARTCTLQFAYVSGLRITGRATHHSL